MKLLLLLPLALLISSCAAYHHGGEYYDNPRYGYNPYGGYRQTYPSFIGRFGVYREGHYGDDHRNAYRGGHEDHGNHGERRGFRGERRDGRGDRD